MYFISQENFAKLLENLKSDYCVFVPVKKNEQLFYQEYTPGLKDIVIDQVRAYEPLKSFFFRAREIVAKNFEPQIPQQTIKPICVIGAKACDLKALEISDFVFDGNDYKDPFYLNNRQNALIISADCSIALATCFCTALNNTPYPHKNFDLNLSLLSNGFAVDDGSDKGRDIIAKYKHLFNESTKDMFTQRDETRTKVSARVEENVKNNKLPNAQEYTDIIERNFNSQIWQEEAKTCVECAACNLICPTCHCFLLYDQKNNDQTARLKIWDSCMIKDFARVAGGANPRAKLWMRLRNRFEKKFDYFMKTAKIYACTGCGRCIAACPAKIDIRSVLTKLVNNNGKS